MSDLDGSHSRTRAHIAKGRMGRKEVLSMFDKSNEQLLSSIASAIAEGKIDAEQASRLLNTIARCEERMAEVAKATKLHDI